jgi:D-lactate dehydrogenase
MIGFFDLRPKEKTFLHKKFGDDHFYSEHEINQAPEGALVKLDTVCVFVNSSINREIISLLQSCDHITTRSTGTDHIDTDAAAEQGMSVSRVPSYGPHTIAEFTFALLLSVTRKVAEAYHQVRDHGTFTFTGLRGVDLLGKTIGVVGTGDIGSHVVQIADGFGMDIYAYDLQEKEELQKKYDVQYVESVERMLPELDVLTLHVPYTKETHHMIDSSALRKLPDTAYLINTARGGLVDTASLAESLQDKQLAGAGLDVLAHEDKLRQGQKLDTNEILQNSDQMFADYKLIGFDNTVVTPHIAFYTEESEQEILQTTTKNIRSFYQDDEPAYSA